MINSALYRDPVLLDSKLHRHKKLKGPSDLSATRNMHAVFITATEFPQAAIEYPIIFIDTGEKLASGKALVSPVVLLGVAAHENLRITPQGFWDARYIPAFVRRFPFLTAGVKGSEAPGVFVDAGYPGFNDTEGEPLFDDDGKPSTYLKNALDFLQRFDAEQQRTRQFCETVAELDLLREMEADATMPGGETVKIGGFMVVDEAKLNALPDAKVIELHRSGMLMLMNAHLMSMGNVRDLMDRKARRLAESAPASAAVSAGAAASPPAAKPAA